LHDGSGCDFLVAPINSGNLFTEHSSLLFSKGDRFYILKGEKHSAKIFAGYTSMECFEDKDRYKTKE